MSMQEELAALDKLAERAELFGAQDEDEVNMDQTDPSFAIGAFLLQAEITEEEWLAGGKLLKIEGYAAKKMPTAWARSAAENAAGSLLESFDEEFGPMEGTTDLTDEEMSKLRGKAGEMVLLLVSMDKVRRLEKVGEVTLGVDAVREVLKGRPAEEGENVAT